MWCDNFFVESDDFLFVQVSFTLTISAMKERDSDYPILFKLSLVVNNKLYYYIITKINNTVN